MLTVQHSLSICQPSPGEGTRRSGRLVEYNHPRCNEPALNLDANFTKSSDDAPSPRALRIMPNSLLLAALTRHFGLTTAIHRKYDATAEIS
jgi:hypothetical protein